MAASVSRNIENPLPAFLRDRMDHDTTSTTSECASDTTDSTLVDFNQFFSEELFSLGMVPMADAFEAYSGYGDLVRSSFEPHITKASASDPESQLNHSLSPVEPLRLNAGFSCSTRGEIIPIENATVTVQQVASERTSGMVSEEERRQIARQQRRLRNKDAARRFRKKQKAGTEALQQKVENLLMQQCELEKQVQIFRQELNALTLNNEVLKQENYRLREVMGSAARNLYT